jgi:hypothetical protein
MKWRISNTNKSFSQTSFAMRFALASVVALGGFGLSTTGVWTSLQATSDNSGNPLSSQSGILSLVLSPNPESISTSQGLGLATVTSPAIPTQSAATGWKLGNTDGITNKTIKPGDTIYRFINLYLSGAVNATGLTMQVADLANGGAGSALSLCNSSTVNGTVCGATGLIPGLQVSIDQCSVATGWATVTTSPGSCGNNSTDIKAVVATTYVKALIATTTDLNVLSPGTYATLTSNSTTADNSTAVARLRFKFTLPTAPTESIRNANVPTTQTIQNQTSALKFTFTTTQRSAISVSS